ncbi:SgcJ/EcaC family oxidoreductase [Escherichia coli]|nr:SgcJ/EcaC family oxidoreductase [Escherichia coli]
MKKINIVILCLFSGASWASDVDNVKCIRVDSKDIERLFDRWNESLKTGDAKKVADNYLSDAILLPTVSKKIRITDAERVDYFEHFLKKKPVGEINFRTIRIGCNMALDTGNYTFTFEDKKQVSARYSFAYEWDGKDWKISSHHSSVVPTT